LERCPLIIGARVPVDVAAAQPLRPVPEVETDLAVLV